MLVKVCVCAGACVCGCICVWVCAFACERMRAYVRKYMYININVFICSGCHGRWHTWILRNYVCELGLDDRSWISSDVATYSYGRLRTPDQLNRNSESYIRVSSLCIR